MTGEPAGNRFAAVLAVPGVRRVLLPYVVGRTASTMVLLAVLLLVQRESRSFGVAGLLSACYAVATATFAPLLGREVDRRGHAPVLLLGSVLQPVGLVGLVLAAHHHVLVLEVVGAALAGAVSPPLPACMRSLWPELVPAELENAAWSVEGVLTESVELLGPLAVGALVLLVSPSAALLAAAALSGLGAASFALAPASRSWRSRRQGSRRRLRTGPLAVPGVRALVTVVLVSTASLSAMEVAIAGSASAHHGSGWTGVLFAVWIAGSLAGGLVFGARSWPGSPSAQLPVLCGLCGLTALVTLLAGNLVVLGVTLVVAGLFIAPATAVQFGVMSHVAPEARRTEAFTWASTAGFLGVAGGSSLAGTVVQHLGPSSGMLLSAGLGLAAGMVALVARDDLARSASADEQALQVAFDQAWQAHVEAVHDALVPQLAPPARIPAVQPVLGRHPVLPEQPTGLVEAIERLEAASADIARVTQSLRAGESPPELAATGTDGELAVVLPIDRRQRQLP